MEIITIEKNEVINLIMGKFNAILVVKDDFKTELFG